MSTPSPSPDAGRVKFRKLRIAWSVFWGSLCLLMIAWWIRSYWWQDGGFVKLTGQMPLALLSA